MQAIDKHTIRLIYICLFFFSQLPWIIQNVGVSVGCLKGVWKVSGMCLGGVWGVAGGCLSDSGYCLVWYDVNSFDKSQILIILISCVILSQWPF